MKRSAFALATLLLACPAIDEPTEPEPEPDEEPTPVPPVLEFMEAYEGGAGSPAMVVEGENVFSGQRIFIDTPVRVHAIEALFLVEEVPASTAHLAIWPDEGHNFFDYLREEPFAEWDIELTDDEERVWVRRELDEPLDIPFPQLLWAGSHHRGVLGQPVLATDDEISQDPYLLEHGDDATQYSPHVIFFPDRGIQEGGAEYFLFGGSGQLSYLGDLMIRLEVERYDVVEPDETWFTDATGPIEEGGIGLGGSGSVGFADYDDDGWMDVFDGGLRRNLGDGTFEDVTAEAGIEHGGTATWGDYDNDGHIDLFLAGGADQLYRNLGDGTFENVTAASLIDDTQLFDNTDDGQVNHEEVHVPTPSAAWVDVTGDGYLDLYQANFMNFATGDGALDYLWINQGDGTFVNITYDEGMVSDQNAGSAGRTVGPADWDNDGDMDIYAGNYRLHANIAWRNDGDQEFTNVAPGTWLEGEESFADWTTNYYGHTIGVDWGDVDNDGDLDLFAGNLAHPRFITFSDKSMFLQNMLTETGEPTFENVREEAGMAYQETDSSPILFDFDNDGWLDLYYTAIYSARPSYLYRNNGDFTFDNVSHFGGAWIYNGWGVSAADLDNDGDLDLYGGRLFLNEHDAIGNSIQVEVRGSGAGATNTSGIGARVLVTTDAFEQLREVSSAVGVGCGEPLMQTVGLGNATEAHVSVVFPVTGEAVDVGMVAAGSRVRVHEDGTVEDL